MCIRDRNRDPTCGSAICDSPQHATSQSSLGRRNQPRGTKRATVEATAALKAGQQPAQHRRERPLNVR
eukprot:7995127-Alexandrium_andersonii.AAC.1